jgi:hypothetical protein
MAVLRHQCEACYHCQHVQFWKAENSWRLGSSHRGGNRRDIPCLVDASDVRTMNATQHPSGVVNVCNRDITHRHHCFKAWDNAFWT